MINNLYTVCLKATRNEAVELMLHIDQEGYLSAGICGEREGVVMLYADYDLSKKINSEIICTESDFYAAPSKLYFEVSGKKTERKNGVEGIRFVLSCLNTGKYHDTWIDVVDATDAQCKKAFTSACIAKIAE